MTPWTAACQASLCLTVFWSLLRLMSIKSVMLSNQLILFPLLLLPSIFPSIRIFSNELALYLTWPKYWSFKISPKYSLERLMLKLKLQYFGHLTRRSDSLEKTLLLGKTEGRRRRRQVGWHHWLDGHESEQAPGVGDGQGSLASFSPWGRKESDTTDMTEVFGNMIKQLKANVR